MRMHCITLQPCRCAMYYIFKEYGVNTSSYAIKYSFFSKYNCMTFVFHIWNRIKMLNACWMGLRNWVWNRFSIFIISSAAMRMRAGTNANVSRLVDRRYVRKLFYRHCGIRLVIGIAIFIILIILRTG